MVRISRIKDCNSVYLHDRMEAELYHHGIKGQKWGKKNGPPYPLDYEQHSEKEKKLNPKSNISGDTSEKKKGLSDTQKKAIKIGAAVVGTLTIAGLTAYAIKSNRINKNIVEGNEIFQALNQGSIVTDTSNLGIGNPGIPFSPEEAAKKCNPSIEIMNGQSKGTILLSEPTKVYDPQTEKTIIRRDPLFLCNCQACTVAYDFNRRGYDVQANLIDTRRINEEILLNKVYKNPVFNRSLDNKKLDDYFRNAQNGERGKFVIKFPGGSSHAMQYEIINGKAVILDSQIGAGYDYDSMFSKMINYYKAIPNNYDITRLDNLEIKDDIDSIKEVLTFNKERT